jgi:hypothetical protein
VRQRTDGARSAVYRTQCNQCAVRLGTIAKCLCNACIACRWIGNDPERRAYLMPDLISFVTAKMRPALVIVIVVSLMTCISSASAISTFPRGGQPKDLANVTRSRTANISAQTPSFDHAPGLPYAKPNCAGLTRTGLSLDWTIAQIDESVGCGIPGNLAVDKSVIHVPSC